MVQVDGAKLDAILEQLPNSHSIFENLKAKLGVTIKIAKIEIEATSQSDSGSIKKIRRLEKYLDQNGLLNKTRPRRTPHAIVNGKQYWWIKETFIARKVIIPAPALLKKLGLVALTVWVSDPKRAPTPKDEWDWTGSFLFLPTVHYEDGKTSASLSGCSALQFIVNAASDRPLFARDWNEPFGRNSDKHPIEKLSQLGAFVAEERKLESLYYVRYITNEQVYSPHGSPVRVNDVVGYSIYISAYPSIPRTRTQTTGLLERDSEPASDMLAIARRGEPAAGA
jgi:hypothetical protein